MELFEHAVNTEKEQIGEDFPSRALLGYDC